MGAALAVHTMIGMSEPDTARPYTNHDVNVMIPDLSWGTKLRCTPRRGIHVRARGPGRFTPPSCSLLRGLYIVQPRSTRQPVPFSRNDPYRRPSSTYVVPGDDLHVVLSQSYSMESFIPNTPPHSHGRDSGYRSLEPLGGLSRSLGCHTPRPRFTVAPPSLCSMGNQSRRIA